MQERNTVTHQAVKLVRSPRAIRLLMDPARREILRQLTLKPQTATQLAEKMRLTKSTIGHHIAALRRFKFIRTKMARPGSHGILEKYYEPTAILFIEDHRKVPRELRKDFLNIHMERLRGLFTAFQITGRTLNTLQPVNRSEKQEVGVTSDSDLMYELANEVTKQMSILGKKYAGSETDMDGETFFRKIYSEALRSVIAKDLWRNILENMIAMSIEVSKVQPHLQ